MADPSDGFERRNQQPQFQRQSFVEKSGPYHQNNIERFTNKNAPDKVTQSKFYPQYNDGLNLDHNIERNMDASSLYADKQQLAQNDELNGSSIVSSHLSAALPKSDQMRAIRDEELWNTQNAKNYAQDYIKNNYGYDIQEIDAIITRDSPKKDKVKSSQVSNISISLSYNRMKKNSQQIEQPTGSDGPSPRSERELFTSQNTPREELDEPIQQLPQPNDTAASKANEQNESRSKDNQQHNASNYMTNGEKSEIQYEEIRVTDSFSVQGNIEQTRNSMVSSKLETYGNSFFYDQKRMTVLESQHTEDNELEGHVNNLKKQSVQPTYTVRCSAQKKDSISNIRKDNPFAMRSSENRQFDPLSIKQTDIENASFLIEQRKLDGNSRMQIGSVNDVNDKTKLKTKSNTPIGSVITIPNFNNQPMNKPDKYSDKGQVDLQDDEQQKLYELSHKNSNSEHEEMVTDNHQTRHQQRSQTNYSRPQQSRYFDHQSYNTTDQGGNQRYDTQEDIKTKKGTVQENQEGQMVLQEMRPLYQVSQQVPNLNFRSHMGAAQDIPGIPPSENDSSVILFNVMSGRNNVLNCKSRSRTQSDDILELNHSNRLSCLAEMLLKNKNQKEEDDDTIKQRMSSVNSENNQESGRNSSPISPTSKELQNQMITEFSNQNVDEKILSLGQKMNQTKNTEYFSNNRSQMNNLSINKKSPALSKAITQIQKHSKSPQSPNRLLKQTHFVQAKINKQGESQMLFNRGIKPPMLQTMTPVLGQSFVKDSHSPIRNLSAKRLQQNQREQLTPNNRLNRIKNEQFVIDISELQKENELDIMDTENEFNNNHDQLLPTYATQKNNIKEYQTKQSGLIQLPKQTKETANISLMNKQRSQSIGKQSNSKLKTIIQNTCFDYKHNKNNNDAKFHRRNQNQLSGLNSSHQQTYQMIIVDDLKHSESNNKNFTMRTTQTVYNATPPASSLYTAYSPVNSRVNSPVRQRKPVQGANSKTCKISDLVSHINQESKERAFLQILSSESQDKRESSAQPHSEQGNKGKNNIEFGNAVTGGYTAQKNSYRPNLMHQTPQQIREVPRKRGIKPVRSAAKSQDMTSMMNKASVNSTSHHQPNKQSLDNSNIFVKGLNKFKENFLNFSKKSNTQNETTVDKIDSSKLNIEIHKSSFNQTMPLGKQQPPASPLLSKSFESKFGAKHQNQDQAIQSQLKHPYSIHSSYQKKMMAINKNSNKSRDSKQMLTPKNLNEQSMVKLNQEHNQLNHQGSQKNFNVKSYDIRVVANSPRSETKFTDRFDQFDENHSMVEQKQNTPLQRNSLHNSVRVMFQQQLQQSQRQQQHASQRNSFTTDLNNVTPDNKGKKVVNDMNPLKNLGVIKNKSQIIHKRVDRGSLESTMEPKLMSQLTMNMTPSNQKAGYQKLNANNISQKVYLTHSKTQRKQWNSKGSDGPDFFNNQMGQNQPPGSSSGIQLATPNKGADGSRNLSLGQSMQLGLERETYPKSEKISIDQQLNQQQSSLGFQRYYLEMQKSHQARQLNLEQQHSFTQAQMLSIDKLGLHPKESFANTETFRTSNQVNKKQAVGQVKVMNNNKVNKTPFFNSASANPTSQDLHTPSSNYSNMGINQTLSHKSSNIVISNSTGQKSNRVQSANKMGGPIKSVQSFSRMSSPQKPNKQVFIQLKAKNNMN